MFSGAFWVKVEILEDFSGVYISLYLGDVGIFDDAGNWDVAKGYLFDVGYILCFGSCSGLRYEKVICGAPDLGLGKNLLSLPLFK